MAYREVTMLEVKEVLRLWLGGVRKKRIASPTGPQHQDGPAVPARRAGARADERRPSRSGGRRPARRGRQRRAAGHGAPPWRRLGRVRGPARGHRAVLRADVRLSKIRKLLRRQGVLISYPTLRRFALEELGWGRAAPTIPLADCGPGEEVQLDTGWMTHLAPDALGRRRRFRAWIFTPVLSRYRFVYPVFRETTDDGDRGLRSRLGVLPGRLPRPDPRQHEDDRAARGSPRAPADGGLPGVRPSARLRHRPHARAPPAGQSARGARRAHRPRRLLRRGGVARSRAGADACRAVVPRGLWPAAPQSHAAPPARALRGRRAAGPAPGPHHALRHPALVRPQGRAGSARPGGPRAVLAADRSMWATPCGPAPTPPPSASTPARSASRSTPASRPASAPSIAPISPSTRRSTRSATSRAWPAGPRAMARPSASSPAPCWPGTCRGRGCARPTPSSAWCAAMATPA